MGGPIRNSPRLLNLIRPATPLAGSGRRALFPVDHILPIMRCRPGSARTRPGWGWVFKQAIPIRSRWMIRVLYWVDFRQCRCGVADQSTGPVGSCGGKRSFYFRRNPRIYLQCDPGVRPGQTGDSCEGAEAGDFRLAIAKHHDLVDGLAIHGFLRGAADRSGRGGSGSPRPCGTTSFLYQRHGA